MKLKFQLELSLGHFDIEAEGVAMIQFKREYINQKQVIKASKRFFLYADLQKTG